MMLLADPNPLPEEVATAVQSLEQQTESRVFTLVGSQPITRELTDHVQEHCRETIRAAKRISVLLDSGGGDIHGTYQLVNLLRSNGRQVDVLVPDYAKSAATFFCLGANTIYMGETSELGPLDAQIPDPREAGSFISALDQFKALEFLRSYALETLDLTVKMILQRSNLRISEAIEQATAVVAVIMTPLYEQVSPLDLGECTRILQIGEHYGSRVLARYPQPSIAESDEPSTTIQDMLTTLIWSYPAHGFIIDLQEAQSLGLNAQPMPKEMEESCGIIVNGVNECVGFVTCESDRTDNGSPQAKNEKGK